MTVSLAAFLLPQLHCDSQSQPLRLSQRAHRRRHILRRVADRLEEGDFIYQGGAAEDTDFGVGVSGAYGETDEACAWIVWNIIRLLCLRKIADMRDQGINRLL